MVAVAERPPLRKYRIVAGMHTCNQCPQCHRCTGHDVEFAKDGRPTRTCPTCKVKVHEVTFTGPRNIGNGQLSAGDEIETDERLEAFNSVGLNPKFVPIDYATPIVVEKIVEKRVAFDLGMMGIPELTAFAEEEEIALGTAKSKDEVLKVIRAALSARQ